MEKLTSSFLCFTLFSLLLSPSSARLLPLISSVPPSAGPSSSAGSNAFDASAFADWNIFELSGLDFSHFDVSSFHISPAIQSLCSGTDYAAECVVSILPLLRNLKSLNPKPAEILRMEMHALSDKANATLGVVKHLIEDASTPRAVAEVLDSCVDNYESIIEDLVDAATAVDDGDAGRLESVLSAAIADVNTCSDTFAELPELESPIGNVDAFLKKLCSNVLAISQMISL